MEEIEMKLTDLYHMLKIHALMANGADALSVTTLEVQGMLRCYLLCMEDVLCTLQRQGGQKERKGR